MLQSPNFKTSFITRLAWSVLSKITLLKTCWQHFSQSKFLCADSWEQTLRETTNQSRFFKTRIAQQLMQRRFVQTDFSILIPQTRLLKTEASKQFSQLRFHNLIHQAMIRRIRWYNQPPPPKKSYIKRITKSYHELCCNCIVYWKTESHMHTRRRPSNHEHVTFLFCSCVTSNCPWLRSSCDSRHGHEVYKHTWRRSRVLLLRRTSPPSCTCMVVKTKTCWACPAAQDRPLLSKRPEVRCAESRTKTAHLQIYIYIYIYINIYVSRLCTHAHTHIDHAHLTPFETNCEQTQDPYFFNLK